MPAPAPADAFGPDTATNPEVAEAAGSVSDLPNAEELAELRAQAALAVEAQERYLRVYADFENFKKRAARDREDVRRAANEGMISRLLPVLDTFDLAMTAAAQPGTNLEMLKAGVQMIQGQLRGIFAEQGLEEIVTEGKDFEPALHDAVAQEETTEVPEGRILHQTRKGYRIKDRLVRPASVVVAKAPSETVDPNDLSSEATA